MSIADKELERQKHKNIDSKWREYIGSDITFEYSSENNCEPEIRDIKLWSQKTNQWIDADALPDWIENEAYNKALFIALGRD